MSVSQAADWLGLSTWSVRARIEAGDLPVVRFQGVRKMFLDINDLEALIRNNKETMDY